MNKILIIALAFVMATGCGVEPYGPLPSEAQLQWQDMEYYMFCHFGPNTFSGLEWGLGSEDPDIFAPEDLDCDQWAATAAAAGMKGIVITAKHHDGFCLWPSAYSEHTVAQSAWRDGKGDVLAELREACDKYGLKFGVYISPWDRNHPSYGTEAYNEIFASTIAEVHSKYGPIYEQWFDGANGGARIPDYDWNLFNSTVYEYSPDAVIFSDVGPGCRWVGNERGYAGETNWCLLDTEGFTPGAGSPPADTLNCGNARGANWVPAECDVSIRAGWFNSPENDSTIKSVDDLMGIWFGSVGRGANLILNVPPDRTGHIPAADSLRLMEFKAARDAYFKDCIASAKPGKSGYELALNTPSEAKCVVLAEDLSYGQRVKSFIIEALIAGKWEKVSEGTTIGHKRILRFDAPVSAKKIRVRVTDAYAAPLLTTFEIY